jgi:hypothetical protein
LIINFTFSKWFIPNEIRLKFPLQNFCIKHFPLPLPSQKTACKSMFGGKFFADVSFNSIASVAQLARAADL